jgi:hypothetical protein
MAAIWRRLPLGALLVAAGACGGPQQAPTTNSGDPGRAAYFALGCASCHGADLAGTPTAPALTDLARHWQPATLGEYLKAPQEVRARTPRLQYLASRYRVKMPRPPSEDHEQLATLVSWLLAQDTPGASTAASDAPPPS